MPLNEYIPDGEPHVWGDRVYHYGSHDKEGGYTFCMQDYVVYSAPVKRSDKLAMRGHYIQGEPGSGIPGAEVYVRARCCEGE